MGGSSAGIESGVYGTLGTPAAGNLPQGREGASSWTDSSGNLWLFGGTGLDANDNGGDLNDLWEYNTSTNQWVWMSGSSTVNHSGVYGTLGTPAAGNTPGARFAAANWTDRSGNLWLFGGAGDDANGNAGQLNDLWEYNTSTNQWTWMGGSSAASQAGVYGTLGTPETSPEAALALRAGPIAAAISGSSEAMAERVAISTIFGSSILPRTNGHG
jgi:hypothetical protein